MYTHSTRTCTCMCMCVCTCDTYVCVCKNVPFCTFILYSMYIGICWLKNMHIHIVKFKVCICACNKTKSLAPERPL